MWEFPRKSLATGSHGNILILGFRYIYKLPFKLKLIKTVANNLFRIECNLT
jgi:hypothetical protein